MTEYIAVLTFPTEEATYEASTHLRENSDTYGIKATTIVDRAEDGSVQLHDSEDAIGGGATLGGSLIGMLLGAIGGPVGLVLGMSMGAAGGALIDAGRDDDADDIVSDFVTHVPRGANAIIAETEESDLGVLDSFAAQRGGAVLRRTVDEVLDTLEAEDAAAADAAYAARKALRAERSAAHKASREERLEKLRAKMHPGH